MEADLHHELTVIQGKLDRVLDLAERHEKELYGNGHDGLVKTVTVMETRMAAATKAWWMAVAAFIASAGNLIWRSLVH